MSNLSLFEITKEQLEIMQIIEESEGILDEVDEAMLAITKSQFLEKSVNYIVVIKHCEAELLRAKEAKLQIAIFEKRKNSIIDKLKNNLENAIKIFGPAEVGFHKLSLRRSEETIIDDHSELDDKYLNKKEVITADKTKIKRDIKAGIEVAGARVVENQNLQIK